MEKKRIKSNYREAMWFESHSKNNSFTWANKTTTNKLRKLQSRADD